MGFPMDPRMQRIIDNASANVEDDVYPIPFSRANTLPPSQSTFSRHFNNSSSLEDVFSFRPPQQQIPRQPQYVVDTFDRQGSQSDATHQQHGSGASRVSLTPRNLLTAHGHAVAGDDIFGTYGVPNGAHRTANRASTLANLRTQPASIRTAQSPSSPEDTSTFQYAENRFSQLQPRRQQPSPPFNLSGHIFTPPGYRSPSPNLPVSSPTRRIVSRREARASQRTRSPEPQPISEENLPRETLDPRGAFDLSHAPPMINGIQLVSTRELPDRFRPVFPFTLFNAVQSKVFRAAYKSDDNLVVSAPTGGGKTAILELAIVRLIESHSSGQFKIVYQAPTKSLCSERARDWGVKFGNLNIATAELTGDTDAAEMRKVGNATIIVTTPEKWDSITRKWKDYIKLLQLVKLFLIDKVHILKENRGATLEAVVSRMKSIGANVRFVALSATVPNSQDIAVWLGKGHTNTHLPAHRETFGEEFRPVKLQKHVHGFDSNINDFAFDSLLDGKLPTLIAKYTHKKPIIVFCFTRKSCENTATKLADWWAGSRVVDRAWPSPTTRVPVSSKDLQDLTARGIAYHHAGLDPGDRMAIEKAYLNGQISVICCTSTLAVGINLPCHLVVLKGTVGYQDGGLAEYSDLEVMQMLGRAGRPQFDDSAVAIIMTRQSSIDRYKRMISGQDVLESTLHLNLIEHLNSEIGLGTVHDLYSAKHWLAGTFMSVRMKQNPTFYKFSCDTGSRDPDERLEQVCERDIKMLQDTKLVTTDQRFTCTEYGQAMSRYMVKFETMQLLLSIPEHAGIGQILHIISQASEFKDLRMKPTERAAFREFNKSPFIKYPIKENVSTTAHKISLIIQAQLGGVDTPNDKEFNRRQYQTDKAMVFERVHRLVRCAVECKAVDCDALATQNALELSRSISAEYWEHLPLQLRQIPNIGPAAVKKMVTAGINSIEKLIATDSATIERVLTRNPPFGHKLLDTLKAFPRLTLTVEVMGRIVKSGQLPKVKIRARLGLKNQKAPFWRHRQISLTFVAGISNGNLAHFWRGNIKSLEKGFEVHFSTELSNSSDAISCFLACDEIIGTVQSVILTPNIPESLFPVVQPTHEVIPKVMLTTDDGGEDSDADFEWDDDIADHDLIAAVKSAEESAGHPLDDNALPDQFIDIDDIAHQQATVPEENENAEKSEPNGKTCKHKCCHDGLDKPRKLQKKTKQDASKETKKTPEETAGTEVSKSVDLAMNKQLALKDFDMNDYEIDNVEIIDLSRNLSPIPYEAVAPWDFRKLHAFHSNVSNSEPVQTLRNNKPLAQYGNGTKPFDAFLGKSDPKADMGGDDLSGDDLPSPPWLLEKGDASADNVYPGYVADLADTGTPFGDFGDDIPDNLFYEAEQMPGEEQIPEEEPMREATSSFVNAIVDYDKYTASSNMASSAEPMGLKRGGASDILQLPEKRARVDDRSQDEKTYFASSGSNAETEVHDRAGEETEEQLSLSKEVFRPEWLGEFDMDFVAMFEGSVDFAM
ncbi:ATP-dependent DNA helicase MER3 [Pseudogymnoascus australis]